MNKNIDSEVIIAGGSVSGLLAARELAKNNRNVIILENDNEIGTPEKCDGLISINALKSLSISPTNKLIQNEIRHAILYSPNNSEIKIDARDKGVIVLDRSEFDTELARTATRYGAEIKLGEKVNTIQQSANYVKTISDKTEYLSKFAIDSRGINSASNLDNISILHAAKYEVQGNWFNKDTIEVYFNQDNTPNFFTWVIPMSSDTAKIGVAGEKINVFNILDKFVSNKGGQITKKIAAPIVISGPIKKFINNSIITVGDAAGQTKPTTGGGIYSGGMGGILAGQAIIKFLENEITDINNYENKWRKIFGPEFKKMLLARRIFQNFTNDDINQLFNILKDIDMTNTIKESNFDFHSLIFTKVLGLKNILKMFKIIANSELKHLIKN